jgi:excisionase family DNA binding protein
MGISDARTRRSTYTVEEVAHILGISRTIAYESVRRGEIEARRFGRRVVIPTVVIDRLLDNDRAAFAERLVHVSSAAAASAASLCWPGIT